MEQYLAIPFDFMIKVDSHKHTKHVYDTFHGKRIPMEGNVKGVLGDNYDHVLSRLIKNVAKYINYHWAVQEGKLELSDYSFTYIINEVDEVGNVWTGRGVSSEYSFKS